MSSSSRRIGSWEVIKQLGKGGQGEVSLVRGPGRLQERRDVIQEVLGSNPWEPMMNSADRPERIERLAAALWKYMRPESDSELGALKVFDIRDGDPDAEEALMRLRNEVAVLRQSRPGLVRLLDANEKEKWMVTEYMPDGTLEKDPLRYRGSAYRALKTFRSLVETVASLHKDNIVHRDIKPANVFFGKDDKFVLGDFGIVFLPNSADRVTTTTERVGPRDYIPQWADLGERLENVQPNFDVYMLGKLLWCMVSGRVKLPREYHRRPEYDVTVMFKNDPKMRVINDILEKCIVEEPDKCLKSAGELLAVVDDCLANIERGLPMLDQTGKLVLPCRICGRGFYKEHGSAGGHAELPTVDNSRRPTSPIFLRVFVCNVCAHYEFFAPNFPDEAARKGWKPWGQ